MMWKRLVEARNRASVTIQLVPLVLIARAAQIAPSARVRAGGRLLGEVASLSREIYLRRYGSCLFPAIEVHLDGAVPSRREEYRKELRSSAHKLVLSRWEDFVVIYGKALPSEEAVREFAQYLQ